MTGGICLDLRSNEDVSRAYHQIMSSVLQYKPDAEIEGVTLQPYFSNPDFEILMGAKHDKGFGPVILFGMGGIFTEVLKDRSLGLPPMNRLLARFTQIDYDREIALVALDEAAQTDSMLVIHFGNQNLKPGGTFH